MCFAGERHRRAVGRDGRQSQVGFRVVGDGGPLRRREFDANQAAADGRTGSGIMPRRHHEGAVGAHVEIGLAQRITGLGRQVTPPVDVEQVRVVGPEVVIPVPHWIAAVQHGRHLVVLAQRSQSFVLVDPRRRPQQLRGDHGDGGRARGANAFDATRQSQRLYGFPACSGQSPQRRRRLLVLLGGPRRNEQQIAVGGNRRR
jgi:hypothetical protein